MVTVAYIGAHIPYRGCSVGATDTLIHYSEQCLTTTDDIQQLSAIKCSDNYIRLTPQKQASIHNYFKP